MNLQALSFRDKLCGVYTITHIESGNVYAGSSVDLYKRLIKHRSDLNGNRHHSPRLQNAWNKYGACAFEMEVVEFVLSTSEVLKVEQKWLDRLNPEYNTCRTAGNRLGFKASEETKSRISQALKGKTKSEGHIERMRLSCLGRVMSVETRAKCGRKGQKKPDGFAEKISLARTGFKPSEAAVEKIAETKRKEYVFTSPIGEVYICKGLRKFCREHDLNPSCMSSIANNKPHHLQHKGWTCKSKTED